MDQAEPPFHRKRNIVLFSDGTGNSSASLFKTNIRRLYEALDVTDPHPLKEPRQFAFYDDGVGTSGFRPLALLGGAFGVGLARNVRELYAFLCRTYREGDEIYAFGFSRGAFTVRVVAGLIMHQGIVPYTGDEAELQRKVNAAYRSYRSERYKGRILAALARPLRDGVLAIRDKLLGHAPYQASDNFGHPKLPEQQQVTIRFIGCFDTVDAYGLPIEELTRAFDVVVFPITMPDATLNKRVRRACQALCLDDRRRTFKPRLWSEAGEVLESNNEERGPNGERITQVWFAGMHSDVGGGYPDDALARVPMQWMARQARRAGLRFNMEVLAQQLALMDESGPMHNSRRGLGGYYRYQPRDPLGLALEAQKGGEVPPMKLHDSVLRRIKVGQDGYVPINLPAEFNLLEPAASPVPPPPIPPKIPAEDKVIPSRNLPGLLPLPGPLVQEAKALAWDWVWWRRLAYAWTLCASLALAALPGLLEVDGCASWACALSPLLRLAGAVLPDFMRPWIDIYAAHPATALLLILMIVLGMFAGAFCEGRADAAMRSGWYRNISDYRPSLPKNAPPAHAAGSINRAVRKFRTQAGIAALQDRVRRYLLPLIVGLAVLWVGIGLLSGAVFSVLTASGFVCRAADGPALSLDFRPRAAIPFDTRQICASSGTQLERGGRYHIRLAIPRASGTTASWWDASLPANPNGLQPGSAWWRMALFTPYRRHLGQPWFKLMLRIGERGAAIQAPDWRLLDNLDQTDFWIYEADIFADRDGEVFFYVNDVTTSPGAGEYYVNNTGVAFVDITLRSR